MVSKYSSSCIDLRAAKILNSADDRWFVRVHWGGVGRGRLATVGPYRPRTGGRTRLARMRGSPYSGSVCQAVRLVSGLTSYHLWAGSA